MLLATTAHNADARLGDDEHGGCRRRNRCGRVRKCEVSRWDNEREDSADDDCSSDDEDGHQVGAQGPTAVSLHLIRHKATDCGQQCRRRAAMSLGRGRKAVPHTQPNSLE